MSTAETVFVSLAGFAFVAFLAFGVWLKIQVIKADRESDRLAARASAELRRMLSNPPKSARKEINVTPRDLQLPP